LEAVLQLFPLDTFVKRPVALMAVVPGDDYDPVIWPAFKKIIQKHEPRFRDFERVPRFAFYERTRKAFAVVATGETARYANVILKKGLLS
jgi:L-fucose mutarotase